MPNATLESGRLVITRPVSSSQLDPERNLTLRDVREKFKLKGRSNRPINLETLRRWANPKRGFRPAGPDGPVLILPTVVVYHEHLTMPEWVEWFLSESARLRDAARELTVPPSKKELERQAEGSKKRMRSRGVEC